MYTYYFDQILGLVQWFLAMLFDFLFYDRELDYYEDDGGCWVCFW